MVLPIAILGGSFAEVIVNWVISRQINRGQKSQTRLMEVA
jgi:hypothetical protein